MVEGIIEHFERRRRELRRYSSRVLTDAEIDEMFSLAVDGGSGFVSGRIPLAAEAFVALFERVVVDERGRGTVIAYSYYLVHERLGELRGYDLDPHHAPSSHRHDAEHRREPWPAVSLREAVEDFWNVLGAMGR